MIRRVIRSRLFKVVVAVAAVVLAWQTYLSVRAVSVIDEAVAVETRTSPSLTLDVVLGFPPEQFHTLYLQSYGRISGVDGDTLHLRDVRPESVGMLARIYWVQQILPGGTP
ncbi:hypothetical protein [Microbacterium jiangjiandongii]|uniref:hypothetical protein n=1 Tax=Microbacterium jiangjiandongii TaxID=3049071 RepID=UPI00214B2CF8|nr:hypothetical protein [Microbacterium sp. zg.Y843]MCR2815014.1 hypothetical protein [Microbacterium sp. zg.Y843]